MIVYQATKSDFCEDVLADRIELKILDFFRRYLNAGTSRSEIRAWRNSMQYMDKVLSDDSIPDDCGVAIEYQIPMSSKRLDFILTGLGEESTEYAILIELKQWESATLSDKDGIINTFLGKNIRETVHPSYQVWSYATLLRNFNQTIEESQIKLQPCAYLHNYPPDNVITNERYIDCLQLAPVFLRGDALKLRNFINSTLSNS